MFSWTGRGWFSWSFFCLGTSRGQCCTFIGFGFGHYVFRLFGVMRNDLESVRKLMLENIFHGSDHVFVTCVVLFVHVCSVLVSILVVISVSF